MVHFLTPFNSTLCYIALVCALARGVAIKDRASREELNGGDLMAAGQTAWMCQVVRCDTYGFRVLGWQRWAEKSEVAKFGEWCEWFMCCWWAVSPCYTALCGGSVWLSWGALLEMAGKCVVIRL